MEKLVKVLKAVLICHDENMKCSDCPYNDECAAENEGSRMLHDAADLFTEALSGSLARRIVEEAQSECSLSEKLSIYQNEPEMLLTRSDIEDCINLIDQIRRILVEGQCHDGDDDDDEPEDPSYFSSGMNW